MKFGRVSKHIRTEIDDRRKHVSQMSFEEIAALETELTSRHFGIRAHAQERMAEKGVNAGDVEKALWDFTVIEANNNRNRDLRVLIRGKVAGKKSDLCAVFSLTYNEIVTVYWASPHNYKDIDKSIYKWDVDLTEAIGNRALLTHEGR